MVGWGSCDGGHFSFFSIGVLTVTAIPVLCSALKIHICLCSSAVPFLGRLDLTAVGLTGRFGGLTDGELGVVDSTYDSPLLEVRALHLVLLRAMYSRLPRIKSVRGSFAIRK